MQVRYSENEGQLLIPRTSLLNIKLDKFHNFHLTEVTEHKVESYGLMYALLSIHLSGTYSCLAHLYLMIERTCDAGWWIYDNHSAPLSNVTNVASMVKKNDILVIQVTWSENKGLLLIPRTSLLHIKLDQFHIVNYLNRKLQNKTYAYLS